MDNTPIESFKSFLKGMFILAVFIQIVWISAVAMDSGWLATSEGNMGPHPNREFTLKVEATGETVFTATRSVSEELREEIMGTVYPTPEAALDAVHAPLPGNPAFAHAVLKCTTRDGVVSENTGGGYHLTNHRFDRDGYRYTKTWHMVYSHPAPVATDVFFAKIDKRYC